MIIRAGIGFEGNWQGEIHSTYAEAVNVCVRDSDEETLKTLIAGEENIGERCLALEKRSARHLFARLKPGMMVRCDQLGLHFPKTGISSLRLTESQKDSWSSPPPPESILINDLSCKFVRDALQKEKTNLNALPLRIAAQTRFDAFVEDLHSHNKPDDKLLAGVIGAGPGLTPSGDDMLVGLCCALHGLKSSLLESLAVALRPHLGNTTLVSRLLLKDALRGSFHNPLIQLRNVLMHDAEPAKVCAIFHQATSIGASSGCDGAWGLLNGLLVFHQPHPSSMFRLEDTNNCYH
ncbi:DUF2877 domain-containing protein [Sneathiella sp. CAU 1612]|uniref:DUF2877 domain-containing protein n=1 Tax=Sneathiella sedimenti TaxID=2816034 RepID=A0ABS3F6G8_9PROT|nr:DUF2877 domain-containing protein [Sneathiella sedimenti]MBO0333969.1 DUF2877 domain-containing protein [Sneathiella sedimenti]